MYQSYSATIIRSKGDTLLETLAVARRAVEVAADRQAEDVVLLDISGKSTFADYFVICSGTTNRQMDAIADEIEKALDGAGATLRRREGTSDSGWVLLDFIDVVVHVFSPEQREFYNLERLWGEALPLVRIR